MDAEASVDPNGHGLHSAAGNRPRIVRLALVLAAASFGGLAWAGLAYADQPSLSSPTTTTVTASADCGPAGGNVLCGTFPPYFGMTASDPDYPSSELTVSCNNDNSSLEESWTFFAGMTDVTCQVTNPAGAFSPPDMVTVNVTVPPPTFANVPSPITTVATGPFGAVVTFVPPTATDVPGGNSVPVSCDQLSGITYPVGTTTVTCTASTPLYGVTGSVQFTVTVNQPAVTPHLSNTSPPVVEGTDVAGSILSCTAGGWSAEPVPATIYPTWQESTDGVTWTQVAFGTDIPWPSSADDVVMQIASVPVAGNYFRCTVSATNAAGSVTAISSPVMVSAGSSGNGSTGSGGSGSDSPGSTGSGASSSPGSSSPGSSSSGSSGSSGSGPSASDSASSGASKSDSGSFVPPSLLQIVSPTVRTSARGEQTLSFSVELHSATALEVTLAEASGKTMLQFHASVRPGRTRFTRNIRTLHISNGARVTLKVAYVAQGKRHTALFPFKV